MKIKIVHIKKDTANTIAVSFFMEDRLIMTDTMQKTATAELLTAVYKNVRMASDSLLNLMPKIKDEEFKNAVTVQLSVYEGFASRTAKLLAEEGAKPEEEGMITKLSAKMGMAVNTLRDASTSHLAEMIIEGAVMGVNDLTQQIHKAETKGASKDALHLAGHLCEYEEKIAKDYRVYLK